MALFSPLAAEPSTPPTTPEQTLRELYTESLIHGQAYENLRTLVENYPGRLAGSSHLDGAIEWGRERLAALHLDRVYLQDTKVPHWERGEPEQVFFVDPTGVNALSACALGGSVATPKEGLLGEVVEVHSIDELNALGRAPVEGKIVFFNGPMDPTVINPGEAYGKAGSQRTRGPAAAAKLGATAALVRSLTHLHDDVPHTGVTVFPADVRKIPAAAISTVAADRLSAAIRDARRAGTALRVGLKIFSQWYPDAPSHNVVGEIRGREFPNEVIVVGGHLDSWDIAPGAHDDGAGIVQSIEVLRLFRALGLQPRHTLRCVLFVNEENGGAGAHTYAALAKASGEKHVFGLESDSGGFQPVAFRVASTDGRGAERMERWLPLLKPYGIYDFRKGDAGYDVSPLVEMGATASEITSDSQRYFDIHHTRNDSLDKVNARELQLGAAAMAAVIYLVDTQGL